MIIVTGGAGFIGSRLIKKLNDGGQRDIILVDDLTDGSKINNIKDLHIEDYIDKSEFINIFHMMAAAGMVNQVYHLGAESSTTCENGKYLMSNNYQYTCNIMAICIEYSIPLLYASSASVYGDSTEFKDKSNDYQPNNMYGYTKLLADKYATAKRKNCTMMGVRYFNVYSDGEFETHKDGMKSPTAWMKEQNDKYGQVELFEGSENFKRDFIHIDKAVDITIDLMGIGKNGIYNVGTGKARSFVDMAHTIDKDINIKYIPMPKELESHYQSFTEADMSSYNNLTK